MDESLQKIVNVVAAKMSVAVGGKNLENIAVARGDQFEDGNVEGAAAEIVDGDFAALFFVEAIGEGRSGGLIDEAKNFEAGDFTRILGGLALSIIEIGGDGDDGAVNGFAKISFGPVFQFAQDERGDFWRSENSVAEQNADDVLARRVDAERKQFQFILDICRAATHETLHGINRALRLRKQAAACGFANDYIAVRIEADDRGAKRVAVGTRDTLRLARQRVGVCDEAVSGTEIDSYDSAHSENRERLKPLPYTSSF